MTTDAIPAHFKLAYSVAVIGATQANRSLRLIGATEVNRKDLIASLDEEAVAALLKGTSPLIMQNAHWLAESIGLPDVQALEQESITVRSVDEAWASYQEIAKGTRVLNSPQAYQIRKAALVFAQANTTSAKEHGFKAEFPENIGNVIVARANVLLVEYTRRQAEGAKHSERVGFGPEYTDIAGLLDRADAQADIAAAAISTATLPDAIRSAFAGSLEFERNSILQLSNPTAAYTRFIQKARIAQAAGQTEAAGVNFCQAGTLALISPELAEISGEEITTNYLRGIMLLEQLPVAHPSRVSWTKNIQDRLELLGTRFPGIYENTEAGSLRARVQSPSAEEPKM